MAVVDTLEIADQLARDGVFTREQAEPLARISAKTASEALATRADLAAVKTDLEHAIAHTRADLESAIVLSRRELEVQIHAATKELIKWFAGILLAHGIAVIGVTVTLVRLL